VTVRDVPDDKLLELALIENIQREDLNAIEEAQAYQKLIETVGLTQEALAQRVGRDRSYVTNYLRLLKLPEDLQKLVRAGRLSTGHARTLLGTTEVNLQRRLARRIIERGLSVRDTERLIKRLNQTADTAGRKATAKMPVDVHVRTAEAKLKRRLGMQVRILPNNRGGGAVTVEYYDSAGLNRIFNLLSGDAEEMSAGAS
jgi:ParB family chromosome partitioning protein